MLPGDPAGGERIRSPRGIIFENRRFVPDLPVQSGIESPGHKRFPDIEDRPGMTPDDSGNLCIGFVGMGCRLGGSWGWRRISYGG